MPTYDLLITASKIFTANREQLYIDDGAIVVHKGKILWLGNESELPSEYQNCSDTIKAPTGWLTPGLIDCHTHLVYAGNRADEFRRRLEGESYADIARSGGGIQATVTATRAATEAELMTQSQRRLNHWLANGVTHVEIKSGYGLNLDSELKQLRVIRQLRDNNPIGVSATLLAAHSLGPEFQKDDRYPDTDSAKSAYIQQIIDEILPVAHKAGLIEAVDGFCENIAFTTDQLKPLFRRAKELGLALKLHAEQLSNQGGSIFASEFGAVSTDHLEYLDESGIKAMQSTGTVAVLLPGAFYYLNETQLPPIEQLREHQIPMAIATDCNPGSSPCTSLPLMINMACVEFGLTPEEAMLGVTIHAAQALGTDELGGSLTVGKSADLVLWDINELADLAYQFGDHRPDWTLYKGQLRAPFPKVMA